MTRFYEFKAYAGAERDAPLSPARPVGEKQVTSVRDTTSGTCVLEATFSNRPVTVPQGTPMSPVHRVHVRHSMHGPGLIHPSREELSSLVDER